MKQSIRIQTISQWYLLKQLNDGGYLGKRKIPYEVMKKLFYILESRQMKKGDFIVLCLKKIYEDFTGIEELTGLYPYRLFLEEKIDTISTISKRGKQKDWYISYARVKGQNTKILVIYQVKGE